MKTYKNSFYHADQHLNNSYIHETIYANGEPVLYKGHEIYHHTPTTYHIVKDGVCIGMVGSLRYAKVRIDCNFDSVLTSKTFKQLYPKVQ